MLLHIRSINLSCMPLVLRTDVVYTSLVEYAVEVLPRTKHLVVEQCLVAAVDVVDASALVLV